MKILLAFFVSISLISCKQEVKEETVLEMGARGIEAKITYGAGDAYDVQGALAAYLPLPFNLADKIIGQDTMEFLILSDRIYKGQELRVIPIGALRLMDEDYSRDLFIAIPESKTRQTFNAQMFSDFAVEYASVKWMIEQYFVNYKGFNKVQLVSWEDEQYALRKINVATAKYKKSKE